MIPAGTLSSLFRSNSCCLKCFSVDKGICQFESTISVNHEMTRTATGWRAMPADLVTRKERWSALAPYDAQIRVDSRIEPATSGGWQRGKNLIRLTCQSLCYQWHD